jgi:hypothetical protein
LGRDLHRYCRIAGTGSHSITNSAYLAAHIACLAIFGICRISGCLFSIACDNSEAERFPSLFLESV